MPDVEENKQDLVDIDTSGPDVDVQLEESKEEKVEVEETKVEEVKEEPKVEEKVEEKVEASDEKQEPKKEEELEQYSEGVKKRIAKLTKKWREAERQREAALEFAKGGQTELDKLKEKLSRLEPGYVNAMEGKLKTGLEAAKAQLLRARETGDINAEVEAQKEIARIGVEESKVSTLKSRYQQQAKETVAPKSLDQAIQAPVADPKAEEWAEKNPWFGQDSAMTYTAFDLHDKLTKEEGFDPKTDEYYTEVDRRMRLDFPHKFDKTETKETTKPTQTVASATRSVKPSRNTVRLTSSQVAIAKKLGVPLEEYAKQLKITKEA